MLSLRTSLLLLVCALAAALAACSTVSPSFSEISSRPPPAGYATVYVYRHYAEPADVVVSIRVADRRVAELEQRTFTRLNLPPGTQTVRASWSSSTRQLESSIELKLTADSVTYLEVTGIYEPRITNIAIGGVVARARAGSGINQIDAEESKATLARLTYSPAF